MSIVFIRRRRLGAGSTSGMVLALREVGIDARVVRSWLAEEVASITAQDTVVRWGCTATLPAVAGGGVLNEARGIHWCADKKNSRLVMQQRGVPVPSTWDAAAFIAGHWPADGLFIARPPTHSQGRHIITGTAAEVADSIRRDARYHDGYVSRLINKVEEFRVFVVGGTVAWVARKTPGNPEQVAWNVAQGGRFDNVRWDSWPTRVIDAALHAVAVADVDFGGVDVMVDGDGAPYVLEINSAPSQTSPYRQM